MYNKAGRIIALVAVLILIAGGITSMAYGQVQGTSEKTFSFVVLGSNQIPITGLTVNLENEYGSVIEKNTSNPIVGFTAYPGNYVISIPSQEYLGYVYSRSYVNVVLESNGSAYLLPGGSVKFSQISVSSMKANSQIKVYVAGSSNIISVYSGVLTDLNITGTRISSGLYEINNTTNGNQVLYVQYYNGSVATYSQMVNVTPGVNTVNVNLSVQSGVVGGVQTNTGSHVKSIQVSIYQNGNFIATDYFSSSYFYVTLSSGTYTLVISAKGYLPYSFQVNVVQGQPVSYRAVTLDASYTTQVTTFTFSNNFTGLTETGAVTLTNSTVLTTLPYANSGSLYNQMKLLGLSYSGLWEILNYSISTSTVGTLLFNNHSYNLTLSTTSLTSSYNGTNVQYSFSYTATYSQSNKSSAYNQVQVYLNQNTVSGSFINYLYTLNIPAEFERANSVNSSIADVSGYSGSISISNSSFTGFLPLKIDHKVKPTVDPRQITANWKGYFESTVLNNSVNNYTLLVPANKNFSLNASAAVYDNVLGVDNYKQMKFLWNFGSGLLASSYNVSESLPAGYYTVSLKVTDVGGNVNETNFTLISDAQNPSFNLKIIQSGKTVLTVNTSSTSSYHVSVNESLTVYFNAAATKDITSKGTNTNLAMVLNWNISGTARSGYNVSYSFVNPTFGSNVTYVNVTIKNAVGNSINITISVHVNDTSIPNAMFQLTNSSGKVVSTANEYQNLTLNASKSFAPHGGKIVYYNWTIKYANGTVAVANTAYKIVSHNSNNSTMVISFVQYGSFKINLKVTDQSNNSGSTLESIFINAVAPEVEIMNVTYAKSYTEGTPVSLKVELKNVGLENASIYYVSVKIGGKVVTNVTFHNLAAGKVTNETVTVVPPTSGQYSMVVSVHASGQPSFFNTGTQMTKAITVAQAAWKLPALIGGIIIAVGVLSFVYYDLAIRKKSPKEKKEPRKQLK